LIAVNNQRASRRLALAILLCGSAAAVRAQQPFVSDDAEVTPRGQWHFEYANQYADLPREALPDVRQDTNNFVVQYGLLRRLEVNVDFPIIAIKRSEASPLDSAFGLGDVDLAAKYKLVTEDPNGARPAFTVSAAVELPTGDAKTQLGSGYTDAVLNTITQKTFFGSTVVHLNLGYQFSGNTLTGAIGIRTPGKIFTGGLSIVQYLSPTLLLGVDVNGARVRTDQGVNRQLQLTIGGSVGILRGMTFDFALIAGRYDSARLGFLLGLSYSP
jgi:hypothetical protein